MILLLCSQLQRFHSSLGVKFQVLPRPPSPTPSPSLPQLLLWSPATTLFSPPQSPCCSSSTSRWLHRQRGLLHRPLLCLEIASLRHNALCCVTWLPHVICVSAKCPFTRHTNLRETAHPHLFYLAVFFLTWIHHGLPLTPYCEGRDYVLQSGGRALIHSKCSTRICRTHGILWIIPGSQCSSYLHFRDEGMEV